MRDMKSQEMEVLRRQLDTVESDLKQAERRIRDHSDNAIVPDNSISNDIPALSMSSLTSRINNSGFETKFSYFSGFQSCRT